VNYLKLLDESKNMFTFDPKGSNTLVEAKEAVAKIQGKCNYGMVTLAEYKSVASLATTSTLPISGKTGKDPFLFT